MRLLVGLIVIFLSISVSAQRGPRQQHGTVNIVLANPQGMVVVTDSMLIPTNSPPGRGQKLFQIDNHTVCTIAGWYSSSGPSIDGVHYPAYTAIPTIIRWFVSRSPNLGALSIDRKIEVLADVLRFGLETMSAVDTAAGDPLSREPSQITLSGIDSGRFKIARLDLIPRAGNHGLVYDERNLSVRDVKDVLIYGVAGVTFAAQPILDSPNSPRPADPILQMFADAMTKDGGKNLTLEEMEQVAKLLEFMTAKRYPREVGGLPQVAIIAGDKAEVTQTQFDNDHEPTPIPMIMNRSRGVHLNRTNYGLILEGPGATFVEDGDFSDVKNQPIDRIFFFRTRFTRCVLYYNGTPNFIFDKSNTVIDSKLVVGPGIDIKSPGVEQIRINFPELPIEDLTGKSLIPIH